MECPSCHEQCTEIYQCKECRMMFCDYCKATDMLAALTMGMSEGIDGPFCPNKDGRGVSVTSEDSDD